MFGASTFTVSQLLTDPEARSIVRELRLPRVVFALLVGGALAVVGAVYQSLFRNPLASPFTFGVSSGAALGASLALMFGGSGVSVQGAAICGALVSIMLILVISRRVRGAAGDSLLLVGVIFSFFCSSILTMLQYLSDYSQLFRVTRWMMGGVPTTSLSEIGSGALCIAIFVVWVVRNHRSFDLMLFGDDVAAVKGVDGDRLYYVSFILSSIVVGWIVAQCGVIGFVGIIVPAIARHFVGLRHRHVVPVSFVIGAVLVTLCDLLGRVARPPFEVPAGVFTAVVGGPIFIFLALTNLKRWR
jgi:iron complex transport system permease protein